ncbi:DUF262 domain-containing protein [Arthrobacter sp. LAPM80]|uniref:DUF262 domain-containing protein n=1 Tax=Arthrobacter sp. LAPM80 TaxID=3141788 RepID=UPI00398B71DC
MFKIRPFEARTLSWWYTQKDLIDTAPPYQRGGRLWTKDAKAFLIDSILNEFDIPKIYVADFSYTNSPLNKSNMQYALIDGKQRLEAIFDFFSGNLNLQQNFFLHSDPSLMLGGLSYKDLKASYPKVASLFENFNLSVMSVITDESTKINELFLRLNTSKPLTGPEYRNAMQGVVPGLIRQISENEFFKEKASFNMTRNADQQVAAKFLLVEFRGELTDTKRFHLDRLVAQGAAPSPQRLGSDRLIGDASTSADSETSADDVVETGEDAEAPVTEFSNAASRVEIVLAIMNRMFTNRDSLLSTQGPLVIYYWFAREQGYKPNFREFLIKFSKDVKSYSQRSQTSKEGIQLDANENELALFASLSRSVNDSGSLVGRYRILTKRYEDWSSSA